MITRYVAQQSVSSAGRVPEWDISRVCAVRWAERTNDGPFVAIGHLITVVLYMTRVTQLI